MSLRSVSERLFKIAILERCLSSLQALFKNANLEQNTGNTITLNSFDIIAQFNADYNFWFNDNTTTIAATQVDFEFIVMHEFIHGCGFASGWSTWFTSLVGKQSFLTPNYYTYRTTTTTTWGGWNPANVFDKYIVENSTQRYLMSAYSTLTNYTGSRSQTVAQFVSSFQASGASFQEATRVFNVVTSGQFALYFQPNPMVSNESVWLQTYAGSFEQGSSIGHTNEIYSKTSDFLMGAAITGGNLYGQTLDQIVAAQGGYRYGAMGPRLVSIMASIGWPVVDGALPNSSLTGTTLTGGSTSSSGANSSANGLNSGTFLGPLTLLQFIGVVVGLFALALMTLSLYAYLRKKSKRRQRSQMRSMPETRTTNHFHGVAPAEPRNGLLSGRPPPPPPPNYPPPPPAMATHTSHSGSSPHAATARVVRPSFAPSHPNGRPPNGAYITPQTSQEEEEQLALALALSVSDGR
ncbi:hypothetical protein M427DRAFT_224457 [Gonapodya prolifera JEL478]|uniref:Uncharacterized protein n=1 Tax=Gonapodya prolifera (strain JEL478) TaxID=1344416 RepID=A0A139AN95_GONPJ|nr:hypothetical protein M427DRAFT_224457 [Gonapodya prolifera JEL478]|eukprot:KXS18220.1 hypothetical protein M427DRAFT_224457 [Gonapodya prolifera JEL478]